MSRPDRIRAYRALAARHPERVRTLTVVGSPPPLCRGRAGRLPALIAELRQLGVAQWARHSMGSRLGEHFPAAGVANDAADPGV